MENRIFVNRKGDKWNLLAEEISYDLGKTWQRTGKTKYDEDNIEYDSCDCSELYRWDLQEGVELLVDCNYYTSHILMVKYGCEEWKPYEGDIIRVGVFLRDGSEDCAFDVPHKKEPNGNTWFDDEGNFHEGYDEFVWVDGEWIKINCDDENAGDDIIEKVSEEWILIKYEYICDEETHSKYQKLRKYVTYANGVTVATDEYKKGELIEEDSFDCGFGKGDNQGNCADICLGEFEAEVTLTDGVMGYPKLVINKSDMNDSSGHTYWSPSDSVPIDNWYCARNQIVPFNTVSITKLPSTMNVTDFSLCFRDCKVLKDFDGKLIDSTRGASTFNGMFLNCSSLTELDLSHFDTRGVNDFRGMFNGCSSLKKLNLSNWIFVNGILQISSMLYGCDSLETLILDNVQMLTSTYSYYPDKLPNLKILSLKNNADIGFFSYYIDKEKIETIYAEGCSESYIEYLKNNYPNANIIL